jgi:nitroreductase
MEFRELVNRRHMVRRYQPKAVPRDVLLRVLEVARHAPSAGFSQGFDFVVLDQPDQIGRFVELTNHPEFGYERVGKEGSPPCLLLPIANKPVYLERYSRPDKARFGLQKAEAWPVPFWDIDTAMALMLIMLAALEEGLGASYFGISWGERELLSYLGVPDGCRPIGVLGLGYPLTDVPFDPAPFKQRRRTLESMVHFGTW